MSTLQRKIEQKMREQGDTAASLSRTSGLPYTTLQGILGGKSPRSDALKRIAVTLDVSSDWLLGIETPIAHRSEGKEDCSNPNFIPIPLHDVEASAGPGAYPQDYPSAQSLMFRRDWVARHGGAAQMFLLHARGDSMTPTISDGDVVLFRKETDLSRPGIYAFRHEDVLRLKRLELVGKTVTAVSDNPIYPAEQLKAKDVTILGRAIWSCGEM